MSLDEKLDQVLVRVDELSSRLATEMDLTPAEMAMLSKEYSDLSPVAETIQALRRMQAEIRESEAMIGDPAIDPEMRELAEEELDTLREQLPELEHAVRLSLLPRDEADSKNAILEVRAGTGGDEAALFAADLFNMYRRYAEQMGWRFEPMQISENDLGGYKEASASISGTDVFAKLKFESGAHRVQRVPQTEASGRIHTSAATVAVLPEAEEVDVEVNTEDLRVDVFRASGAGGQHVNTTESAVRITHIPSGIVVSMQDEKSQHKNRAKAMTILRSRLYEHQRQTLADERASARKSQVGSGDRSERIRTYNFPQGRVTDHRINLTLYKLDKVLAGEALDEVIDALIAEDQAERLAHLE
ncbi:MAG TPA: peptide chain release factor 1 [Alphaproteobacteria bacterium]|nr:peptide chain release factor 1 [Alphaproteobacteria bacterium]